MQTRIHMMTGRLRALLLALASAFVIAALTGSPASADTPPAGAGTTSHGYLFERGVFTPIDHPGATTTAAIPSGQAGTGTLGINDRGQVLGIYEGRDRMIRPFVRDRKGRFTTITRARSRPLGEFDEYVDINNRGAIVGFYNDDQGFTTTGFLRTRKGRFLDIDVPGSQVTGPLKINDRRQVVGIYVDADAKPGDTGAVHGFVWDDGDYRTIDVPGAIATIVFGINNRGQTVGSYVDHNGAYHGFVRDRRGAVTTLPEAPGADPASGGTQPTAINDRGQIVGAADDAKGGSRGFLFERGRFRMIAGPAAAYTRALDINQRGQIVGDYGTRPPAG
jgi:probable HAF family extracellular repeat protein